MACVRDTPIHVDAKQYSIGELKTRKKTVRLGDQAITFVVCCFPFMTHQRLCPRHTMTLLMTHQESVHDASSQIATPKLVQILLLHIQKNGNKGSDGHPLIATPHHTLEVCRHKLPPSLPIGSVETTDAILAACAEWVHRPTWGKQVFSTLLVTCGTPVVMCVLLVARSNKEYLGGNMFSAHCWSHVVLKWWIMAHHLFFEQSVEMCHTKNPVVLTCNILVLTIGTWERHLWRQASLETTALASFQTVKTRGGQSPISRNVRSPCLISRKCCWSTRTTPVFNQNYDCQCISGAKNTLVTAIGTLSEALSDHNFKCQPKAGPNSSFHHMQEVRTSAENLNTYRTLGHQL